LHAAITTALPEVRSESIRLGTVLSIPLIERDKDEHWDVDKRPV